MNLRISINAKKINGPYGGGNQFANTLEKHLRAKGYEVFRNLVPHLDLILILVAQKKLKCTSYTTDDIADYLLLNPNTVIVHRVNTCDEPRGSNLGINNAVLQANHLADYTVFVSSFVKLLFQKHGFDEDKPHSIILNGADEEIFNPDERVEWQHEQKLKVVTHHWSTNYMKGFDVYERLDHLLKISPFKDFFGFTYVGNLPFFVEFQNTRVIQPLSGIELARILKQHHIYVTAARHEPGGNHYIEAIRCGLPVLYLRSGSLPEYCATYGVEFTLANFEEKLLEMRKRYLELSQSTQQCNYTGERITAQYEKLFKELVAERRTHPRPQVNSKRILRYAIRSYDKNLNRVKKALCRWLCS